MDYETILNAVNEDPEFLYRTSRGSSYAHMPDTTSIRNRSGQSHLDTRTGLQPRSGKTVYMSPKDVASMGGIFQNPDMATHFMPIDFDRETKKGTAGLMLTEDFGPRKKGSYLAKGEFTVIPKVGMVPVEIYRSESPIGSSGSGIHWGTPITEVISKDDIIKKYGKKAGAAGLATTLASAAKSAQAGEYAKAIGELGEAAIPFAFTPSEVGLGTTKEYQQEVDAIKQMTPEQRKKRLTEIERQRDKRNYAFGGMVDHAGRNRLI